ncbi:PCRF domain-containing protein [Clostridium botulinum]|nr:PCRF domain-containing protein [Clostridium botulinum]NFO54871.1 PCRF domain-containing protein [Clostridium botulinum]
MKNLIVYDSKGNAFFVQEGTFYEPIGQIKALQADIPDNKLLKGVDIKTGQPILEDIPKSEIELLKEKIESLEKSNAELTTLVSMQGPNA